MFGKGGEEKGEETTGVLLDSFCLLDLALQLRQNQLGSSD